jgi:cystathionine beta-lyase
MKYDFDQIIDRRGSGALKTDALGERYGRPDLIPLWVADMDFATPPFIIDVLRRRLEHPVLGYTVEPADYWPTVMAWVSNHHGWATRREWYSFIPGVVKGIGFAVNVFVKPGEKVIIQPPVYHPFRLVPQMNGREVVFNPLIPTADGSYTMDFEGLERVADDKCKLLILSNPHNPAGIVWPAETLRRLAEFCHRRGIIVISDEIHCDLVFDGHKHVPFATSCPEAAEISITFGAPTKTFNIAGLASSYAIVPNEKIRKPYYDWLQANELNEPHLFAPIGTIAAFSQGEEWRRQLLDYVSGNMDYVIDFCAKHIPQIKPLRPEATYLMWLDCRELGLSHAELVDLFVNKARLALNDGEVFNPGGEGHMRLNVASPRSIIEQAMKQLEAAVKSL